MRLGMVVHAAAGRVYSWGWGGSQGSHATEGSSGGGQLVRLCAASTMRLASLYGLGVQGLGHDFDYPYPVWVKGGAFAPRQGLDSVPRMAKGLQVSCGFNHSAAIVQY